MKIQDTSAAAALMGSAKTSGSSQVASASFADVLKSVQGAAPQETNEAKLWKDAFANYTNAVRQRINDIGFQQYVVELKQVKKLMEILSILYADGQDDVKDEIEKIMEDFKASPPKSLDEMISRIQDHINSIPDNAPNKLKERMKQLMLSIAQMMTMSDSAVEALARAKGGTTL